MAPPRVVRVTRIDSSPAPAGEVKSRLRRVRGLLDATEEYPRRLASRWAMPLFVLAFLAVVYCTLFPFNFKVPLGMTLRQAAAEWDWRVYDPSDLDDFLENIVLFLPFGFAVACLARSLGVSRRWLTPTSLGASVLFSTCIEILQLWLPTRDSALADILANTTGGFLGGALFAAWGTRLLVRSGYFLLALRRALTAPVCLLLILIFCAFAIIGPYHLRHRGQELSSWDSRYYLSLGSEPDDISRAWYGTIYSLDLANYALSPSAVARAYEGELLSKLLPVFANYYSYVPYGDGDYEDRNHRGPPLRWCGAKANEGPRSMLLSGDHYLISTEPPSLFSQSVAQTNALTVRAVVQSGRMYQDSERVIASICKDVQSTNFTLMQDRADLQVHVRTLLSGNRPAWIVPDLFVRPGPHDILITYQEPVLRVYVDSPAHLSTVDTPGDFYEVRRFTARFDRLPMKGFGLEIYRILYYFILFVPIGLLVGLIAADPRVPQKIRTRTAIAGLLGPVLIMQGMLLIVDRRMPRADNILLNLFLPLLAAVLMIGWLAPEQIAVAIHSTANMIRRRGR